MCWRLKFDFHTASRQDWPRAASRADHVSAGQRRAGARSMPHVPPAPADHKWRRTQRKSPSAPGPLQRLATASRSAALAAELLRGTQRPRRHRSPFSSAATPDARSRAALEVCWRARNLAAWASRSRRRNRFDPSQAASKSTGSARASAATSCPRSWRSQRKTHVGVSSAAMVTYRGPLVPWQFVLLESNVLA